MNTTINNSATINTLVFLNLSVNLPSPIFPIRFPKKKAEVKAPNIEGLIPLFISKKGRKIKRAELARLSKKFTNKTKIKLLFFIISTKFICF